MATESVPSHVTSEYEAVRDEILFRLKIQQDMINYTFVTVGLLATFLGLYNTIDIRALLLLGPLVIVFLQFVYFKQHVFIHTLANYIATQLCYEKPQNDKQPPQRVLPFAGWENYLTSYLYERKGPNFFSALLGYAEGGFPTLIGLFYLVASIALAVLSRQQLDCVLLILFLAAWCFFDLFLLGFVVIIGARIRAWVRKERRASMQSQDI